MQILGRVRVWSSGLRVIGTRDIRVGRCRRGPYEWTGGPVDPFDGRVDDSVVVSVTQSSTFELGRGNLIVYADVGPGKPQAKAVGGTPPPSPVRPRCLPQASPCLPQARPPH